MRFIPLDTHFQPLDPIWSCAHLDVAYEDNRPYTSCRLGDHAARLAWAERIQADRLERWREIAREFGEKLKELIAEVYAAKAVQLECAGTGRAREAERRLRAAVDTFLTRDFELMDARAEELEQIGFPADAMKVVTADALEALVRRAEVFAGYEPPAELLAPFSADIREFVRGLFDAPASA